MADRPNFYEVLGLDPSVDDWSAIEAAIEAKRREWSGQGAVGNPAEKRKAQLHLALVDDMASLADPAVRRQEAAAWSRLRTAREQEIVARLDRLIETIVPGSTLRPADIDLLVAKLQQKLPAATVTERLREHGFVVEAAPALRPAPRPRLNPSTMEQIRHELDALQLPDLYAFLNLPRRTSAEILLETARQTEIELQELEPGDPELSVRQTLVNFCGALFGDEDAKARYDRALAFETMEALEAEIDFAGRDGVLTLSEIDLLVCKAREAGAAREDAEEYLDDYAALHDWSVQRQGEVPSVRLPQCGYCRTLVRDSADTHCVKCGEALTQPCPRCGAPTPTEHDACARCGCRTSDAALAKALLAKAEPLVAGGAFDDALVHVNRALHYFPDWRPALDVLDRVKKACDERDAGLLGLQEIVSDRRLVEAASLRERLARTIGPAPLAALGREIEDGLSRARTLAEQACQLQRDLCISEAIDRAEQALTCCSDLQAALDVLAANPPPAPSELETKLTGSTIRLVWAAADRPRLPGYLIVRKRGGLPRSADDGERIGETRSTSFDDDAPPLGAALYYAVYTMRRGVTSAAAATAGPHLLTAPVTLVDVQGGDGKATLRWTRPPGCARVEVWRGEGSAPAQSGAGTELRGSDDGVVDTGLVNGSTYGYRIVALFPDPLRTGGLVAGPPVETTVTPIVPPDPVLDLVAQLDGDTVVLTWTPIAAGDVQIRCSHVTPPFDAHRTIGVDALPRLGDQVPLTGRGSAQVGVAERGQYFFVPVTVIGRTGVIGRIAMVTTVAPVAGLVVQRSGNSVVLTWTWPPGVDEVLLRVAPDAFAMTPDGGSGSRLRITRAEYDRQGTWELRRVPRERQYISVFAKDAGSDFYSTPATVLEAAGQAATVAYAVRLKKKFLGGVKEAAVELTCATPVTLAGIVVVRKEEHPPIGIDDGQVIAQVDVLELRGGSGLIPLPAAYLGASGFIKLFFRNASDAQEYRLLPPAREQLRLG